MDVAFLLRARRMLGNGQPARLDHAMLLAALSAQQAASATARAQARGRAAPASHGAPGGDALTELLLAGPAWRDAAEAQGGCFRPETGCKPGSPERLPSHFSLPSTLNGYDCGVEDGSDAAAPPGCDLR
jgi:hypothetical protein